MNRPGKHSPIRIIRETYHLTQQQLAEALNERLLTSYGKSAVSKWENNKNTPPKEILEEIGKNYGGKEAYLLEHYGYLDEAVTRPVLASRSATAQFQAGAMRLPLFRILGGNGNIRYKAPDGIRVVFHNTRLVLPQDIHDNYHPLLKIRKREAEGCVIEQRNMIRLDNYEIKLSDPHDEPWPLVLHVSITDYYDMMVTNRSLDSKLPGSNTSLRDLYAGDPLDFSSSELANPLAVNLSLVTMRDRKVYVARRGKKVATNPGGFGPAVSGTGNPLLDLDDSKVYNPFITAQRESVEELLHPNKPDMEDITIFGLGRTLRYYFPFLYGELRLNMSEDDLRSFTPQDNWDTQGLISVPFTVPEVTTFMKQLYRYMVENNDLSVGTTIFSLYESLIYEYPDRRKEIIEMLEKA